MPSRSEASVTERAAKSGRSSVSSGARQPPAAPFDPNMRPAAFFRIAEIRPFALHPLQEGKARAIDPLVNHARGNERCVAGRRRSGQLKRELGRA